MLLLRGALLGMFATISFFVVLRVALVPGGIWLVFPVAIAVALAIQFVGLAVIRRT